MILVPVWRYPASCSIGTSHFVAQEALLLFSGVLGVGQFWSLTDGLVVANYFCWFLFCVIFEFGGYWLLVLIVWGVLFWVCFREIWMFYIWIFGWRLYGHSVIRFTRLWFCCWYLMCPVFFLCLTYKWFIHLLCSYEIALTMVFSFITYFNYIIVNKVKIQ